jgi:hypothetical protein
MRDGVLSFPVIDPSVYSAACTCMKVIELFIHFYSEEALVFNMFSSSLFARLLSLDRKGTYSGYSYLVRIIFFSVYQHLFFLVVCIYRLYNGKYSSFILSRCSIHCLIWLIIIFFKLNIWKAPWLEFSLKCRGIESLVYLSGVACLIVTETVGIGVVSVLVCFVFNLWSLFVFLSLCTSSVLQIYLFLW